MCPCKLQRCVADRPAFRYASCEHWGTFKIALASVTRMLRCTQVHCFQGLHVLDTHSGVWHTPTTTGPIPSARAGESPLALCSTAM